MKKFPHQSKQWIICMVVTQLVSLNFETHFKIFILILIACRFFVRLFIVFTTKPLIDALRPLYIKKKLDSEGRVVLKKSAIAIILDFISIFHNNVNFL